MNNHTFQFKSPLILKLQFQHEDQEPLKHPQFVPPHTSFQIKQPFVYFYICVYFHAESYTYARFHSLIPFLYAAFMHFWVAPLRQQPLLPLRHSATAQPQTLAATDTWLLAGVLTSLCSLFTAIFHIVCAYNFRIFSVSLRKHFFQYVFVGLPLHRHSFIHAIAFAGGTLLLYFSTRTTFRSRPLLL